MNGFKISERTIYGCMDDKELTALFTGYGYQARFVEDLKDIDADLGNSMEWALSEIKKIQKAARSGKPIMKPRWPVIIMRTPKVSNLLAFGVPPRLRDSQSSKNTIIWNHHHVHQYLYEPHEHLLTHLPGLERS